MQGSGDFREGVVSLQWPIGLAGGAYTPPESIREAPKEMTADGGQRARAEHEIVEVLVKGEEAARGEQESQHAHPAERDIGHEHDGGKTYAVAAQGFAADSQVIAEAAID